MDALHSDPRGFVLRYRTALQIQQRIDQGKTPSKNDRGVLMGTLAQLYAPEEKAARDAIKAATAEQKLQVDIEAASASLAIAFTHSTSTPVAPKSNAAAAALVAAQKAANAELQPRALSTQCNVCYGDFNSVVPSSPDDAPLVLRVHMRLCGHCSICSDCFQAYLSSRITSDDCMPFLPCPEANCLLPLSQADLVASVSPSSVRSFEAAFHRAEEIKAKRNNAAWDSMHAAALKLDTSDHNSRKGKTKKAKPAAKRLSTSSASSTKRGNNSNTNSDSDDDSSASADASSSSDESGNSASPAASSTAPVAPQLNPADDEATVLLPSLLLVKLVQLHMQKLLARCKDWLPCGTFPLPTREHNEEHKQEEAASAWGAPSEDSFSLFDAPAPASSAAALAAAAPAAATGTLGAPACSFGFMLGVSLTGRSAFGTFGGAGGAARSAAKLKKCDQCGLLQELKKKTSSTDGEVKPDDAFAELIASGTLRACPICEALQMKDVGMCNILQCHGCQIWWNWSSRATGKNQAQLKDRARMEGTMWEPGELAYQQRLQREDPEAFRALLARNGIEYRANYIRGGS